MAKKILPGKAKTFLKIILAAVLLYLVLIIIEQVSVYQTLKGDGKIHHVAVRPVNKK